MKPATTLNRGSVKAVTAVKSVATARIRIAIVMRVLTGGSALFLAGVNGHSITIAKGDMSYGL